MTYDSLASAQYRELLSKRCFTKKYREEEMTWHEVCRQDPDYVTWLVENMESLEDDMREALEWGVDHAN